MNKDDDWKDYAELWAAVGKGLVALPIVLALTFWMLVAGALAIVMVPCGLLIEWWQKRKDTHG